MVGENGHKSTEMHTLNTSRGDGSVMKIAVTRLAGKEKSDAARCAAAGHTCYSVHPLRSAIHEDVITAFADAVGKGEFDGIFFTSALPAKLIAPRLDRFPRVIAIGPQTAGELRRYDIDCEVLTSFYSRDFVPYLGDWIRGKRIGIPRADVPNPGLLDAITAAGGIPEEYRCYSLEPTGTELDLAGAEAILFTSAMSFTKAIWTPRPNLLAMAIGEITAKTMRAGGTDPGIVGDGSLEGTLGALNAFLASRGEPAR
jgi:uroporphyrinogen-III synthase